MCVCACVLVCVRVRQRGVPLPRTLRCCVFVARPELVCPPVPIKRSQTRASTSSRRVQSTCVHGMVSGTEPQWSRKSSVMLRQLHMGPFVVQLFSVPFRQQSHSGGRRSPAGGAAVSHEALLPVPEERPWVETGVARHTFITSSASSMVVATVAMHSDVRRRHGWQGRPAFAAC